MAKIAIDAGHGLYTSGKRCMKKLDANETREWVLNDRVADALATYLKSAGHTILRVDDTDGSSDITLANRVKAANNWNADAYISVHHNAGINGGSGGGTVVYVAKSCSSKSVSMQNAVYKHAIAECNLKGNRSDGTLASNFYVIKNTKMPAILIECGFMDSSTDIRYILNAEWSKKMGLAIAKGVCDVFGGNVNASASKPASSTTTASKATSTTAFKVKVKVKELNIRAGAGANYKVNGSIKDCGTYTIVATAKAKDGGNWGKLKSGAGWINISSKYVNRL